MTESTPSTTQPKADGAGLGSRPKRLTQEQRLEVLKAAVKLTESDARIKLMGESLYGSDWQPGVTPANDAMDSAAMELQGQIHGTRNHLEKADSALSSHINHIDQWKNHKFKMEQAEQSGDKHLAKLHSKAMDHHRGLVNVNSDIADHHMTKASEHLGTP